MRIDWATFRSAVWPECRGKTALTKNLGLLLASSVFAAMAQAQTAAIAIDYPQDGSIFPPEITSPTFLFRDSSGHARRWRIDIDFGGHAPAIHVESRGELLRVGEIDPRCVSPNNEMPKLTPEQASAHTWMPDAAIWSVIKKQSVAAQATVTITGVNQSGPVSSGRVGIWTSRDPAGAPIFYRDVPLMPSATEKGVIKPLAQDAIPLIQWSIRNIGETRSRVVLTDMPTCANCHSFSLDGKTMGMDMDGPQNDKGLYALAEVKPKMSIRNQDMISWNPSQDRQVGLNRVGFMSQVSPDGQYVLTTVSTAGSAPLNNFYVVNFTDYRFLQVFYPTRGVLAWYSRATGRRQALPGADDPRYVQTDGVWSPDGKYVVFARAEAKEPYPEGQKLAEHANDLEETQIQYDLYRIPFNDGKGGQAVAIAGASQNGMSNNFPKVSPDGRWIVFVKCRNGQLMRPDSQLYIVPAQGGVARRLQCNTPLMNSWHSFSPNGRWLVFSSKSRSPYTQMFLTHLDEDGNDSPAVLIENTTAANRAVNIPEFVNIPPDGLMNIDAPVTDYYRVIDTATDLAKEHKSAEAAAEWRKAVAINPKEASNHYNLGAALFDAGRVEEAIAQYNQALDLSPEYAEAHTNLAAALARNGRLDDAIAHFTKALELNPANTKARSNLGAMLAQAGRTEEAIPYLRAAAAERPQDAEAQTNLGLALALARRFDEAIRCLKMVVTASPDSFEYRLNLGRVLAAAGHFAEAIPHFERAVRLSGGREPRILDMLADVYAETGRFLEAAQAARQALEVAGQSNPQFVDTLKSRISYYESRIPKAK